MASSKFALPAWLLWLTLPPTAGAAVQVTVGPTPIPDGEARSAGDITVVNERLAFALAVRSPVPYGVPRGAIVDVAPVVNGKIGRDCVVFADFIPNNWSAWPNTFQHVEVLEAGHDYDGHGQWRGSRPAGGLRHQRARRGSQVARLGANAACASDRTTGRGARATVKNHAR